MSFIERLFGLSTSKKTSQPDVLFGRYSDAYKSEERLSAFDRSLVLFEKEEFLEAYKVFLSSLKDDREDNIRWTEQDGVITFEFLQGSQRITGTASAEKVRAQSRVAAADELNVGMLRRLVGANFSLKFSRFALSPDNCIVILFDTNTVDGSPMKLSYALRELAIHADKQDDLLLDEFKGLKPAEERTYTDISEAEKLVKFRFIHEKIKDALAEIDKGVPDPNQYPGIYAYLLLSLTFKLDYLVRPEGFMMDTLERIHALYYAQKDKKPQAKVAAISKELQKLLERSQADFYKEMYRTRSTFGVNPPVSHGTIAALIEGELPNMEWPLQQNYEQLAMAIPNYIAGFSLFKYAPPKPDRELFHLFYQIIEPAFFAELGYAARFSDETGRLDKRAIFQEIKLIAERNKAQFPYLKPDTGRLDFGSICLFAKSYMLMIKDLNLTKAE